MRLKEEILIATAERETYRHPKGTPCEVSLIGTAEEFDSLELDWMELVEESSATIYQTYEWVRTWWKYYSRPSDRLFILVFRIEGKAVGIAPLYLEHKRLLGIRATIHVHLLGGELSDYGDFILRTGYEMPVLKAFAGYLSSSKNRWDVLDVEEIRGSSSLVTTLPDFLREKGIPVRVTEGNVCPQLRLPFIADDGGEKNSLTNSYNFKRRMKKLQESFTTKIDLVHSPGDDIEGGIDAFIGIHGNRWKSLGFPNAFDDPNARAFHLETSRKFVRRGWLYLYLMKLDGEVVAVCYNFHYRERVYMYQCNAYASSTIMKCSPGFLIRAISIEQGDGDGMRVFDYLRGDEEYKYMVGDVIEEQNRNLRITSPSRGSRARYMLFLIWEIYNRSTSRARREYYSFRRFCITEEPGVFRMAAYAATRSLDLLVITYNFMLRNAGSPAMQRFQILDPKKSGRHKRDNGATVRSQNIDRSDD